MSKKIIKRIDKAINKHQHIIDQILLDIKARCLPGHIDSWRLVIIYKEVIRHKDEIDSLNSIKKKLCDC